MTATGKRDTSRKDTRLVDEWSVVDGYAASSMRCEALTSSMARWGSSQEEARVANLVMLRFFACALPRLLGPSAEARVHLVPLLLVCAAHEQVEEKCA